MPPKNLFAIDRSREEKERKGGRSVKDSWSCPQGNQSMTIDVGDAVPRHRVFKICFKIHAAYHEMTAADASLERFESHEGENG